MKPTEIKTVKVEKICPLSLAMTNDRVEYCFKENCGWYDSSLEMCSILALVKLINANRRSRN